MERIIPEKSVWTILIKVYIIGFFLIAGCASIQGKESFGRTMFIPLKSSPPGAKILLDGKEKGFTPSISRFTYLYNPYGSHEDETRERILRIEKYGYEPYIVRFSIKGKEYEKIPDTILLKRLDSVTEAEVLPGKDRRKTEELKETGEKHEESPEETVLIKENNETQEIKQYNETITETETETDNENEYQTVYTIQTGSFIRIRHAIEQFNSIIKILSEKNLDYLRVEKIGKFYTVRLGRFEDFTGGKAFLQTIKTQLPMAIILKSRIKDNSIIRTHKK
ncbi:MAG TPA: hypothetical protein ENH01_12885 [Nitrospirae bacterium]|nr:hypothetical protein [Nitrospirota bacterium]